MDAIGILSQARFQLTDSRFWCRGVMERGEAKCLGNVIGILTGRDGSAPAVRALLSNVTEMQKVRLIHYGVCAFSVIAGVNDICTHAEMLAWLDRAIASLKAAKAVEELKENALASKPELEMA